jgi:hypothetical protein
VGQPISFRQNDRVLKSCGGKGTSSWSLRIPTSLYQLLKLPDRDFHTTKIAIQATSGLTMPPPDANPHVIDSVTLLVEQTRFGTATSVSLMSNWAQSITDKPPHPEPPHANQ